MMTGRDVGHPGLAREVGCLFRNFSRQIDICTGVDRLFEHALGAAGAPRDAAHRALRVAHQQRLARQNICRMTAELAGSHGPFRLTQPYEALLAGRAGRAQAEHPAQLSVVAKFRVRIQRQVIGEEVDVMRQHAGQWALPGGRVDEGESVEQAALRELHEEVGLNLPPQAVLGRLDSYISRSGYAITPVVVWAGAARDLQPNPDEVASVHRIGLNEFLRADAPILEPVADSLHPVLKMPVGSQWIAAPTAAMIYQFREVCLLGRATRVAHFEQPLFAWR